MTRLDPQYLQTSHARPITSIDGITQMNDMLLKRKDDKRADESQNMQRENSMLDRNMQAANFAYRATQDDISNKRNATIDANAKADREAQQNGLYKVDSAINSNPEVADMYKKLLSTDVSKADVTTFNQQAAQLKSKLAVLSANSDSPELTKVWKSKLDEIDNISKSISDYKLGVSKAADVATATTKVVNDNKTEVFYKITKDDKGNPKYTATTVMGNDAIINARNSGEYVTQEQYANAAAIAAQNDKDTKEVSKAMSLKQLELDKEANTKGNSLLDKKLETYGTGWNGPALQAKIIELKKSGISDYDIATIINPDDNLFVDFGNKDHNHSVFLQKADDLLKLKAQKDAQNGTAKVDDKSILYPGKKMVDELRDKNQKTFATSLNYQD